MTFPDVPPNHPHREAIDWAAGQGLIQGFADGSFRPEQPLTRAQWATLEWRKAGRPRKPKAPSHLTAVPV